MPGSDGTDAPDATTVSLRDGRQVDIRPLRPDDAPTLATGLARLSPEARYFRFMTAMPRLTEATLAYFTNVDGHDHAAFGARDPSRPGDEGSTEGLGVGTARYIRSEDDPTSAEFAVTVIDEYQRTGLATALLDRLSEHARSNGIRRFTAEVLAENHAIRDLIRKRGGHLSPTEDAAVLGAVIPLDEIAPTDRPA